MSTATLIFTLSVGFIAYVLIGYPLLLAIYAKLFPKSIRKQFAAVPLSIIIPVKNGDQWIEAKLKSLLQSDYPQELIEILVVSDGSSDRTSEIVRQFGDPRVRLLELPPGGKATAVSKGLANVNREIIVLTDVRQPFDPNALSRLVACFADRNVGVVTGQLVIREGNSLEEYNTGLYWKYEKWIRRNLNRVDAMLGATGAIYAIRREFARSLPSDTLLDDVYLPFVAAMAGSRIYFEDSAKAYDFPTSLHTEFRRKVRTQAGIYQIIARFPQLLSPSSPRFVHFLSHKVGRLFLPFAMGAMLVSSFWLPHPIRMVVVSAQVAFYSACLLDVFVSERSSLKRITGVARTCLVLVVAALCATTVFFLPAQRLWKETAVGLAKTSVETEAPESNAAVAGDTDQASC
jgi:poly-beta-1,6-N-acetyl-D-glucosamine synthase